MKRKKIDESLAAADAAATAPADSFERPVGGTQAPDAQRRGILVRVSPSIRRELKLLSFERGSSVQVLMVEAINQLLAKHGRRPIA